MQAKKVAASTKELICFSIFLNLIISLFIMGRKKTCVFEVIMFVTRYKIKRAYSVT